MARRPKPETVERRLREREIGTPERINNAPPNQRRRWTLEEVRRQMDFIEQLMTLGVNNSQIVAQAMRPHPTGIGLTRARSYTLINRVAAKWEDDDRRSSKRRRGEQVRRIMRYIQSCQGRRDPQNPAVWLEKPNYGALSRFEKQLALIQGTEAPLQVDVQHSETLAAVFSRYTVDQLKVMKERALERKALAELALREHPELAAKTIITTSGTTKKP
jgi:hypothetical protein